MIDDFDTERALLWIVLLPLLASLVNGIAGRKANRALVSTLAVGSVACSFLMAVLCFNHLLGAGDVEPRITSDLFEWFTITIEGRPVPVVVRFVMDHLSAVMTVMVTGIATLIHVYSTGYMSEDPGYARFMTYLNLFTASMLILVLGSSFPVMFVGWEGVGLCSYLLIGFWYENADYAAAGRKAFVVNRIGDFGVLIGMFLLSVAVVRLGGREALEFSVINQYAEHMGLLRLPGSAEAWDVQFATAGVIFLFLGCAGKSAQIPLYVWLPDAMAGPTPVSALIHAATMVTAGVYLCCRVSPVIVQSPTAMAVIALVGACTALLAASIALVQNQMKKILAYSTVSQLGFMFAAVGCGAFGAGIFHVFTHAFFKACLFLGAGSVMHAVHAHGDADIRYLGGLKKYMPRTWITFLLSCCAIAGFPLFSGFFSKDEILLGAATWATTAPEGYAWVGWTVFVVLVIAATMTAFYMFRLYFRTFHGEFKGGHAPDEHHDDHGADDHADEHHAEPHESPLSMSFPLMVLAAGAVLVGFLGMPHALGLPNYWGQWLTPGHEAFAHAVHEYEHEHHGEEAVEGEHSNEAALHAGHVAYEAVEEPGLATLQFRMDGELSEPQHVIAPSWVPWLVMGFGTLAALLGFFFAFQWYRDGEAGPVPAKIQAAMPGVHRLLMDKWRVDELYGVIIVGPTQWLGYLSANIDRIFVDGMLTKVSSSTMRGAGYMVTRLQNGVVYAYAAIFVVGAAGLFWWYTFPHPSLSAEAGPGEVAWAVEPGYGYVYSWDFDSDGEWDLEDVSEYEVRSSPNAVMALVVPIPPEPGATQLFSELRRGFGFENNSDEVVLSPDGDIVTLPDGILSEACGGRLRVQYAHTDEDGSDIARLRVLTEGTCLDESMGGEEHSFLIPPGAPIGIPPQIDDVAVHGPRLERRSMRVAIRATATVRVCNAFDNCATTTEEVTMPVPTPTAARTALAPTRAHREQGQ